MKLEYKLFFAIPFDTATKNLYYRISCTIRKRYPSIATVIGSDEVGPSPVYSDIASFKVQNRLLNDQFKAKIQESDVVIADLTHNNPNVHFELGIALMLNKNILRVTGRSVSELGFDIRNLEVYLYNDEAQLTQRIFGYLDTFFKIKQLQISPEFTQLYCKEPVKIELRARGEKKLFDIQSNCPPDFMMRDGAVRAEFELLSADSTMDWFGIYFRAGDNPGTGSHLVYVRQNGNIEVVVYPGPSPALATLPTGRPISGRQTLLAEFENDYLHAQIGDYHLETNNLSYQGVGRVLQAAWRANVDVHSVEMICRDTIA